MDLQEDHVYADVQEQHKHEAVKEMRRELYDLDHDCKLAPDHGCSWCGMIYEATDDEIIEKYREVVSE